MAMEATHNLEKNLPVVAIVGRPNVGKSSLFNRILNRRSAIVHEEAGVTRDRIAAVSEWFQKHFLLVDTGGLGIFKGERAPNAIDELIRQQLDVAIEGANKILLVVEVTSGLLPLDKEIGNLLRERDKEVVIAANKADNTTLDQASVEFAELGFDKIIPISCLHNRNIGELLDEITINFSDANIEPDPKMCQNPKVAVIGRPNVGKSSIINHFLGEERVIVSNTPGTTRDAVDTQCRIAFQDKQLSLTLIDTAGIRLNRNIRSPVEYFSLLRTKKTIKRSDIVLMVLDGTTPVTSLDKRICRLVINEHKPCILLANKWDIACKSLKQKELYKHIRNSLPFLGYSPILTCCALSGYNFKAIVEQINEMYERLQTKFPTALVNRVIKDIFDRYHPDLGQPNSFKVYYGVHKRCAPPTFLLFVNKVSRCSAHELTNVKKRMRHALGLHGLPVNILLQER